MNNQKDTINTGADDELSLIDIYHVIMKGKWIIIISVIISILLAMGYIVSVKPVYQSKAVLRIGHVGQLVPMIDSQVNIVSIEEPDILSLELTNVGKDLSVELKRDLKKNSINIINLRMSKDDPNKAREALSKITNDLLKRHELMFQQVQLSRKQQLDSLQKKLNILQTNFNINSKDLSNQEKLKIIEIQSGLEKQISEQELLLSDIYLQPTRLLKEPTLNAKPVKPDKPKTIAIALILGIMAGVVLAFLTDYFQKYLPSASQKSIPE